MKQSVDSENYFYQNFFGVGSGDPLKGFYRSVLSLNKKLRKFFQRLFAH